jgi:hypothetical protein
MHRLLSDPVIANHLNSMDVTSEDRFGIGAPTSLSSTDDQPYHTVEYMQAVKNILIAKGITFQNAFATTPLCCPARSAS